MKRLFVAAALSLGLVTSPAQAEDHPPPPPRGEHKDRPGFDRPEGGGFRGGAWRQRFQERRKMRAERLAHELSLTDAQKEQMQRIRLEQQRQVIKLRAELQLARLDLGQLLREARPDQAKVIAQVEKLGKIEIELKKVNILSMVKMKSVLTPEQAKKFQELRERRKKAFRGGRFGRWGGQGRWRDRHRGGEADAPAPSQPPPSRE